VGTANTHSNSFNAIAYSQELARQQAQQLEVFAQNLGHNNSTITNSHHTNGVTTGVGQAQLGDYPSHPPLHPLSHPARQPHPSSVAVGQQQQHTLSAHPSHQAQGPHLLTRQVSLPHLHHLHQVQAAHDLSSSDFFHHHHQQQLQQQQQQASQTQQELNGMDMMGFHHHAGSMDMDQQQPQHQQQQQHVDDDASFGNHAFMAHYHHPSMDMDISGHLTGDMESMSFDAAFALHLMNSGSEVTENGGDGGGGHTDMLG
jgi:hypothetical protein